MERTKTSKTSTILRKSNSSKSGLSVREELQSLNSSISLVKGLLATLSTNDPPGWTSKCQTKLAQEHTRILLQEVMDEIWNADSTLQKLRSVLAKRYAGICLL